MYVNIISIDLSSLISLAHVGASFAQNCTQLKHVSLPSPPYQESRHDPPAVVAKTMVCSETDSKCNNDRMEPGNTASTSSSLVRIPDYFVSGCTALRELDLRHFTSVTKIGDSFAFGCSLFSCSLTAFHLPDSVTEIGRNFLVQCAGQALSVIDLSRNTALQCIGENFAAEPGKHLQRVILPPSISVIKKPFLKGVSRLKLVSCRNGVGGANDTGGSGDATAATPSYVDGCSKGRSTPSTHEVEVEGAPLVLELIKPRQHFCTGYDA